MKTQDSSRLNPHLNPPAAGEASQEITGLAVPYALGLETNTETAQIINAQGWHVATVAIDPAIETAAFIVRAVNSHAALVAALEETARSMEWVISAFPDIPAKCNFSEVLADAKAALSAAKGVQS